MTKYFLVLWGLIATVIGGVYTPLLAAEMARVLKFYNGREPVFRETYQKFLDVSEAERLRKVKAGEPPLTKKEDAEGVSAAKFLFHNQAIFQVLCVEQLDNELSLQEAFAKASNCINQKQDHLNKYLKLEEYVGTLGRDRFIKCQIKARDYKSEGRFPPYAFLKDATGPQLFDFDALNACILSNL